jgi:thiamine biosynthesis lipoprotein
MISSVPRGARAVISGGLALLLSTAWLCATEPSVLVERSVYLMGTRAHLSVWSAARSDGQARLERALQALEETEAELSTWRADSTVSVLNQIPLGVPWRMPPSLCALLGVVAEWRDASGRAFDPAIGALTAIWDVHGEGRIPSSAELERARVASGFRHLGFDRARCTVTRQSGVTIDVGGFGKGEALDRAARTLGDVPWMIDLGGQISVGGVPPREDGWHVSIAHPHDRSKPILDVRLTGGSLSTSGGSERDLMVDGRRIGHHLDPRTGIPAKFGGSVSVWHASGLVADILSTALFVMGPVDGLAWAEARGLAACYLDVDSAGRHRYRMTTLFRRLTTTEQADLVYYDGHGPHTVVRA